MPYNYKPRYRRKLPHRHSPGGTLFVTFRLAGSIPRSVIKQWENEKQILEKQCSLSNETSDETKIEIRIEFHRRWFREFVLHASSSGPMWLSDERIAQIVFDSILLRDGKEYILLAFCIMSNHVHIVFRPNLNEHSIHEVRAEKSSRLVSTDPTYGVIMQSLKGYTARKCNQVMGRSGAFWDAESYDHEIRNSESYARIVRYTLNNPVKAGLVKNWEEWRWSWVRPTPTG